MTDTEIKECQEWLDKLKLDDIPKGYKWQRSLMDITGIKHHENMWSDIYKFFFDIKESHNLGDLFIRSLESLIKLKANFLDRFLIDREFYVKGNIDRESDEKGKIDLLLCDNRNNKAIIIENKVNHLLDNDLNLYYREVVSNGYSDVIVIVIGLHKYDLNHYEKADGIPNEKKYSITHQDFIDKVNSKLPEYYMQSTPQHLYLLQEFAKNIKNHTNMIDKKEVDFFFNKENQQKMVKMHDIYRHIKDYLIMVMECKDSRSPLKDHIKSLDLRPMSQKIDKGEEYVKYIFNDNFQIMLTVFYKNNILRPKDGEVPHIHIVLEIQKDIKKVVENNMEKFIALRDSFKLDGIIPNGTKRNEWWHFASMIIPVNDLSKLSEVVSEAINKECPLYKLGHEILNEIEKNKQK